VFDSSHKYTSSSMAIPTPEEDLLMSRALILGLLRLLRECGLEWPESEPSHDVVELLAEPRDPSKVAFLAKASKAGPSAIHISIVIYRHSCQNLPVSLPLFSHKLIRPCIFAI